MDESAPRLPNPTSGLPSPPGLPAPTLPSPAAAAAPPAPATPVPPAFPPPTPAPRDDGITPTPVPDPRSSPKRPLMLALTLITVLTVGIGAFVVSRASSGDTLTDTSPNLVADADADTGTDTAFSFSAAATDASTAGSMRLDMTTETREGRTSLVATVDRASERISVDADLSQLSSEDSFFETPDSVSMILDGTTSTMYLDSAFFGLFSDAATPWISTSVDELDDGSDSIDMLFANPFEMDFLFGDVEPVDLGLETVDGEELRHFQVATTVAEVLADEESDFADLRDIDGIEELDEVIYDVWVSEDNTIRRVGLDLVVGDQANGFDMWLETSPDGVDVPIPDPSDVTDLDEFFGSWNTAIEDEGPVTLGGD